MKTINLDLRPVNDISILDGFTPYGGIFASHTQVSQALSGKKPNLITVIINNLKSECFYKNKFGKTTLISTQTRFHNLVFDSFIKEYGKYGYNDQYAKWLKKYDRNDQTIFDKELSPRYGPAIYARFKNHINLHKPRKKRLWERYYHLPEPLDSVDWRNSFDNIFIWEDCDKKYFVRGGSGSSQARERNSIMIYGYAMTNKIAKIRTKIYVYDGENNLLEGTRLESLAVPSYDIGSNYGLSQDEENLIMRGVIQYTWDVNNRSCSTNAVFLDEHL